MYGLLHKGMSDCLKYIDKLGSQSAFYYLKTIGNHWQQEMNGKQFNIPAKRDRDCSTVIWVYNTSVIVSSILSISPYNKSVTTWHFVTW
jgi:hypothetical protein